MTRGIICDKCTEITKITMTNPKIHELGDFHLCHGCYIDFKKWLKEK